MRNILKSFLFSFIALFGAAHVVEGFSIGNDVAALASGAIVFGTVNSFLKPILKLVALPLNLITLGSFSFVINAVLLYLTVQIVPDFLITAFRLPGLEISFSSQHLVVPPLDIPAAGSLLLTSVVISLFMVVLGTIFD